MTVRRPDVLGGTQADSTWAASGGLGGAVVLAVGRWRRRDEDDDPVRVRLERGRVGTPDAGLPQGGAWLAGWLERPANRVNRWHIRP
jgi:hypothetical protein